MPDLTTKQERDLDHARYLAESGAPIFRAPGDSASPLGFRLPPNWQKAQADPSVVDEWVPGDALCLVTGALVDVIDIDPRNGGDPGTLGGGLMPTSYGQQATPSGGTHDLIAALGVAKGTPFPGIDVQAGDVNGKGRGFVFLAPTERPSKATGEVVAYSWTVDPNVDMLTLIGGDESGTALAQRLRSQHRPDYEGPGYGGPSYADLTPAQQAEVDESNTRLAEGWRRRLEAASKWRDGHTDDAGRGWEALSRDWAWAAALRTVAPWSGLDEESGRQLHDDMLPAEMAADEKCKGKWSAGLLVNAAREPVEPPDVPWGTFEVVRSRQPVDVTNESAALMWLEDEVGRGRLSGVFRRSQELVHTPRIGETGYVQPSDDADSSGPAQVRRIDPLELARRIDHAYVVTRRRAGSSAPCLFPQAVAGRAAAAPDLLRNARDLLGVTHTPVVRADGTILDAPGYDDASQMLYLPEPALMVPPVAEHPTSEDVGRAGDLLLAMVADFPFVTPHDRANYLGALLTPLVRPLVPPPYKLIAVGAPQRGSGKSLLAWVVRELHGGVFKSEFPTTDDELRKFITSTLDATTSPVVQFDNVAGTLKSSVLDGLLTSRDWSDRLLGHSTLLTLQNDRLWMVTGNNVHIGGDLERRTLWVTIDANMERPEERGAFAIPALEVWVAERRGELLWALLTLVRSWVAAGKPRDAAPTSDSFGPWVATIRGILGAAELGESVGLFGHADSTRGAADPEQEEWATFLAAAQRVFGSEPWTARDLIRRTYRQDYAPDEPDEGRLLADELPGDIAERMVRSEVAAAKSLGRWLGFRDRRWAGGLAVRSAPAVSKKHANCWRIVDPTALESGV